MRQRLSLPVGNLEDTKKKLLHWAATYAHACYLDSNQYAPTHGVYECLVASGANQLLSAQAGSAFAQLAEQLQQQPDWWFGYLGYDLKNEVEALTSENSDGLQFPDLCFFRPQHVVYIQGNQLVVETLDADPQVIWQAIENTTPAQAAHQQPINMQPRTSQQAYLQTIQQLRQHIKDGDVYEINYCQEFFATDAVIEPLGVFSKLNALSNAPFAAFLKLDKHYALCSSPERFLRKSDNALISQPIKGTRKRGQTPEADEALKATLKTSEKDRAENVMIVDLVRNDLARSCVPGTVQVDELFGIYTFQQVHHMISTISGLLQPGVSGVQAIQHAFPMGSMTGAPKVRMMQLAEQYEQSKRGLYAGAIGYFAPNGDFDFNVVIRTLLYNAENQYLSYHTGGAIVWDSVPEEEYEECLLKAEAMLQALQ